MGPVNSGHGQNQQQGLPAVPNQIAGPTRQQAAAIRQPNAQFPPDFRVVNGQPNPLPRARQIQDDWKQSVAELNVELKALRDAMSELLREIKALIKDYNKETELKPICEALDRTLNSVGYAFRATDEFKQTLGTADTSQWDHEDAQIFHNAMNRFTQQVNQVRQGRLQTQRNVFSTDQGLEVDETISTDGSSSIEVDGMDSTGDS